MRVAQAQRADAAEVVDRQQVVQLGEGRQFRIGPAALGMVASDDAPAPGIRRGICDRPMEHGVMGRCGLMRLVVTEGTGEKADVPGYLVGGKTGTADKNQGGRYRQHAILSSFLGAFPINDPRFIVLVMVDEPRGTKETYGFATAGWTAAPAVAHVIARMATLLGIPPVDANDPQVQQAYWHPAPTATNDQGKGVPTGRKGLQLATQ